MFVLLGIALFLFSITLFLLWYFNQLAKIAKLSHLPGPKPHPILGNGDLFDNKEAPEIFHTYLDLHRQYGPDLVTYGLLGEAMVQVSSAAALEKILPPKVTKKDYMYGFLESWLGTGLITSGGEKWFHRRKTLTPSFHFKILDQFLDVFSDESDKLVKKLEPHARDGQEFDIHNYIALHALNGLCETSMGVTVNALENPNNIYVKSVEAMAQIFLERSVSITRSFPKLYPLHPLFWRERSVVKTLHNYTDSVIRSKRKLLEQNGATGGSGYEVNGKKKLSFLDLMLHEPSMSDSDIREEVDTFMYAGHDTTTAGIYFTLLELALNQDVQQRLFEEIDSVLGKDELSNSHLGQMKYLDMVCKETLRKYPSIPIVSRELNLDTEINGGMVPKGTIIMIMIIYIHRNPAVYPDPDRYDPERFNEENSMSRGPFDYIPFSSGPRNCIGQKYAMMEMKITLVKLLRSFRFVPGKNTTKVEIVGDLVLRPAHEMPVKIEKRKML